MAFLIPLIGVILAAIMAAHNVPPVIHNTQELAAYTKCDPEEIRSWMDGSFEYKEQGGQNWLTSATCFKQGWGDCKCYAQISEDTLNECPGYSGHMACLKHNDVAAHCVTFFSAPDGRKGFINSGAQANFYPATAQWHDMVPDIIGGAWVTP